MDPNPIQSSMIEALARKVAAAEVEAAYERARADAAQQAYRDLLDSISEYSGATDPHDSEDETEDSSLPPNDGIGED